MSMIQNIKIWWAKFSYQHFHDFAKPHKNDSFGSNYVKLRTMQSMAIGHRDVIVIGDSRLDEFCGLFDQISGTKALPISGSTARGWLGFWKQIVGPASPRIIVEDLGGNDFLGGRGVAEVLADQLKLYAELKSTGAIVFVYEICLLGQGAYPNINIKILEYNDDLKKAIGSDFIPVNDILSDGNYMKPEYDCGDHVHHSIKAYIDCYGPRIKERLIALKFPV